MLGGLGWDPRTEPGEAVLQPYLSFPTECCFSPTGFALGVADIPEPKLAADMGGWRAVEACNVSGELAYRDGSARADVERRGQGRADPVERADEGTGHIIDEDEISQHAAIFVYRNALAGSGEPAEEGDNAGIRVRQGLAWAIYVLQAQYDRQDVESGGPGRDHVLLGEFGSAV